MSTDRPHGSLPAGLDRYLDRAKDMIARHGWTAIHVQPSEDSPAFSYTIGLEAGWDHPEVILVGYRPDLAAGIFERLLHQIRAGVRYEGEAQAGGILADYDVAFRPVTGDNANQWLRVAPFVYDRPLTRAIQVFLPDIEGRFPWEADVDPETARLQVMIEPENAP